MATEVTLPELGESVTEGTITEWLVEVGDEVNTDDPLFELSSDKIDTEVPSPASGVLKEIKVDVDETVEVGTVVAIIGDADENDGDSDDGDDAEASDEAEDTEDSAESSSADGDEDTSDDETADADEEQDDADESDEEDTSDDGDDEADAQASDDSEEQASDGGGGGGDVEVTLPELGESVTEGTITEWLVEVGDEVNTDDPLFELSSDKIDTEVPSPASGTLKEIKVDVDETVEVGTVVAIIGSGDGGDSADESEDTGSDDSDDEQEAADDGDSADEATESSADDGEQADASSDDGVAGGDALMSPIVRRMISEHDLDAEQISGSGQGGRITREDVEAAISDSDGDAEPAATEEDSKEEDSKSKGEKDKDKKAEKSSAFDPGEREHVEKLTRIRQRIAAKMQESLTNTAQLTTVQEADMTAIMRLRAQHKDEFKKREGASLSPFAFLARAALLAIKRHPTVNAKVDWDGGEVLYRDYVNLGVAVDTEKGLLVPNVKNADDLTLAALARNIADVAGRARGKGQLEMSDIQGGTFTVTNTGSRGVLIDTPILNYPEVAIMGTGAIQKRPVVVEDGLGATIAIRDLVYLCLTYDHQILDGADAARFVTDVKEVVETHDWEAELGL